MRSTECNKQRKQIKIDGIVQGVGFRPFVLRTARRLGIGGTVSNDGGALLIEACGPEHDINEFICEIKEKAPPGSLIVNITITTAESFSNDNENSSVSNKGDNKNSDNYDFLIIESSSNIKEQNIFISPDIGICEDCLNDTADISSCRYLNPFNSCVSCGPRFSIIERMPYDRENTAMKSFSLCINCVEEYKTPDNRRCHAQTICCNDCGPVLRLYRNESVTEGNEALFNAVALLREGKIIAVKGIGGYHFACSPYDQNAVKALRNLKMRDEKPFAVMFRDIDAIQKICAVDGFEKSLLMSPARPIVLLELLKNQKHSNQPDGLTDRVDKSAPAFAREVLFGDNRCGCFLPYTALHKILLDKLDALVMTSANYSGSAIFVDDSEMIDFYIKSDKTRFSGVLFHDRKILRAVEDSVAQIVCRKVDKSKFYNGNIQLLRRSRGYAPGAIKIKNKNGMDFLAMGGDLKAAFCYVKDLYAFQGPYLGDLEEKSVFDRYRVSISEFAGLLGIKPFFVLCDNHPGYFSSALASELGLPLKHVQHHHAHIASVMAEHGFDENERVIGVAFDGTGYGDDGCVWGGEFMICEDNRYRRVAHLRYTDLIGGDDSVKDALKTAFCFLVDSQLDVDCNLNGLASDKNGFLQLYEHTELILAALNAKINTVKSSSMGRLFDAAAAIIGIGRYNNYEGECAVLLQREAEYALKSGLKPHKMNFGITLENNCYLADSREIIRELLYASNMKAVSGALALGFHIAVADLVKNICVILREKELCNNIVLSGGVFQNRLLLELTQEKLNYEGFCVYINNMTVPNDGGISLGQAFIGGMLECV